MIQYGQRIITLSGSFLILPCSTVFKAHVTIGINAGVMKRRINTISNYILFAIYLCNSVMHVYFAPILLAHCQRGGRMALCEYMYHACPQLRSEALLNSSSNARSWTTIFDSASASFCACLNPGGGGWSLSERKRRMQKARSSGMREMLAWVQP